GVDAQNKGIDITTELGRLGLVPLLRAFRIPHRPHQFIVREIICPPVLGSTPASFAIQREQQIRVIMHLSIAESIKQALIATGENVRDPPGIPLNRRVVSGFGLRGGNRGRRAGRKGQGQQNQADEKVHPEPEEYLSLKRYSAHSPVLPFLFHKRKKYQGNRVQKDASTLYVKKAKRSWIKAVKTATCSFSRKK